jgi:hypothetical protein
LNDGVTFIMFYNPAEEGEFRDMSTNGNRPKEKYAYATVRMPDGKEHEIPLAPKQFKTGRQGFYAQIPGFIYDDEMYGGQIQIWKKTKKDE